VIGRKLYLILVIRNFSLRRRRRGRERGFETENGRAVVQT
jgi:hypothetical protein